MPALPTLTLTDAQAERCLAAFGSVAAYRAWLRDAVRDHVLAVERQALTSGPRARLVAAQGVADTATDPLAGVQ